MEEHAAIGSRIRALREELGVQAQELGSRVGLDPSAISNIERGRRSVKSDELAAIAKALGVSPLAILEPESLVGRLPVAPRASSGTLLKGDVLSRLTGLAELHEVLAEGGLKAHEQAKVQRVDTEHWFRTAPKLAAGVVSQLERDVPGDDRFVALVRAIEEQFFIDVLVEERDTDDVLGASITDSEFSLIFVNANQQVTRALFTLGHELGHTLAKDGRNSIVVDDDLTARSDSERFANAFAAALLLPEEEIRAQIPTGVPDALTLCRLLDHWGTSFETLVYRLHNLRMINAEGRDRLRSLGLRGLVAQINDQQLTARLMARVGSRPARHTPSLIAARAYAGYRQGAISARPLAGLFGIDPHIVSATMDLDAEMALGEAIDPGDFGSYSNDDLYGGSPIE
jgi:Zn-dependent peptidase ImmA (M78 family)/DNA-binding XRE family transcriptional regulator